MEEKTQSVMASLFYRLGKLFDEGGATSIARGRHFFYSMTEEIGRIFPWADELARALLRSIKPKIFMSGEIIPGPGHGRLIPRAIVYFLREGGCRLLNNGSKRGNRHPISSA